MRPYVVFPLLALLNMGANAASLHAFNSKNSHHLQDAHNRRQLHNADFSSSGPVGPAAKGAITNTGSSVSGSSPSGFGSLDARAPPIFDPRRGSIGQPLHRRVISVSNPGAESTSIVNGDPTVPPRAETGSHDADIDVDVRDSPDHSPEARMTNAVVSRQDDEDPSSADDDATAADTTAAAAAAADDDPAEVSTSDDTVDSTDGDTADPVVSRDFSLALNQLCPSATLSGILPDRILGANMPVNVLAASGTNTLAGTGLLGGFLTKCDIIQEFSEKANEEVNFSPRNDNLDIPTSLPVAAKALPVAPPVALPLPLPARRDIGSASRRTSEPQAWSLPDLKATKTRRQLGLPVPINLPIPRDAPANEPVSALTTGSGVLSAPGPRDSFVVRKEDRL